MKRIDLSDFELSFLASSGGLCIERKEPLAVQTGETVAVDHTLHAKVLHLYRIGNLYGVALKLVYL